MEEYLLIARSVTQAQRMTRLLSQYGIHAAMGRAPVGLTGSGCSYVLRLPAARAAEAADLLCGVGFEPLQVYGRQGNGYREVKL